MNHTAELQHTIEKVYSTFAGYTLSVPMSGCPHCAIPQPQQAWHEKPLRTLSLDDLDKYIWKAMTTWGTENDFKYFLPRILELLVTNDDAIDASLVCSKLHYAQYDTWPEPEREVVQECMLAWWSVLLETKAEFQCEAFVEIAQLCSSVKPLLERWAPQSSEASMQAYEDFVNYRMPALLSERKLFTYKHINEQWIEDITQWLLIQKQQSTLENAE